MSVSWCWQSAQRSPLLAPETRSIFVRKSKPLTRHAMDLAIGGWVFNVCWLSAGVGLSMLQMLLLAQGWRSGQQALVPATLASAWAFGLLLGARLSGPVWLWGCGCVACALLWLGGPELLAWHISWPLLHLPGQMDIMTLALLAVLLGASSAAWLGQQRVWPPAGERTVLVHSLIGLTIGLLVAWTLPVCGGLIALACCLPLLLLDVCLTSCAPLPSPGSVAARWLGRYWSGGGWSVPLERSGGLQSWREFSRNERLEPERSRLLLPLLASVVAVILASVWGAIPTPFAAGLHIAHTLDVLYWLPGGQLVALVIGTCSLFAARNVIGFSDRLLPTRWQPRLRRLALFMPLGMAASLTALGTPFLQNRWWLALSLAGFTLLDAVWSILLPRLMPGVATVVQSQRHLLPGQRSRMADPLHQAYTRACEAQSRLLVARAEGLAIVVCTLLLGWLIDRLGSVDAVLLLVGVAFALVFVCAALIWMFVMFTRRLAQARLAFRRQEPRFSGSSFPMIKTAPHR